MMTINFDMDGTIANLYGVQDWLTYIINGDPTPYAVADPLVNMSLLARYIHKAQAKGYKFAIISWLAKNSTTEYDELVIKAKRDWLAKHLPSVVWDEIHIVAYGTPKNTITNGILFDDEKPNRDTWGDGAFLPSDIFNILKTL